MEELGNSQGEERCPGGEESKIENAEPSGGESIKETDWSIEMTMSEERSGDEGDGQEKQGDGKEAAKDGSGFVSVEEGREGCVDERMKEEKEDLDNGDKTSDTGEWERLSLGHRRVWGGHRGLDARQGNR